jgi:hypothetical protein
LLVIVQVLVTQRQRVHPLRHQFFHAVLDLFFHPMVPKAGRKARDDSRPLLHLAQQQPARTGGDRPPVKSPRQPLAQVFRSKMPYARSDSLFKFIREKCRLGQGILSCAVSVRREGGGPGVLGVGRDGFDDQVEFIGAVDFARHAVGLARHKVVGLGEVMQAIDTLGVAVEQQQHRTRPILFPREQEQMIGSEVEHG